MSAWLDIAQLNNAKVFAIGTRRYFGFTCATATPRLALSSHRATKGDHMNVIDRATDRVGRVTRKALPTHHEGERA